MSDVFLSDRDPGDETPRPKYAACDHCGLPCPSDSLVVVKVAKQTHWSPAEYEDWCPCCATDEPRDPAYARALARSDDHDGWS